MRPLSHLAAALIPMLVATAPVARATADYGGLDGYGTPSNLDTSPDGYARQDEPADPADFTNYVIIEADDGSTEQIEGETVIVVQEPAPLAATAEAPPAPKTVVVEPRVVSCPGGIWVDGYWAYEGGRYIWVDGHCVVERVNYVFVPPRWDFYANVWWFVPGYFRPCAAFVTFGYFRPWVWFPPHFAPFYTTRHPVPVHRGVPVRHTAARPAPVGRIPTATRPTRVVPRSPAARGSRSIPSRRVDVPTRTDTVRRVDQTPGRTAVVRRVDDAPTRTGGMRGLPESPLRTGAVRRVDTSPVRTGTVARAPSGSPAARSGTVRRPPSSVSRTSPVARGAVTSPPAARPSVTRSVPRVSPGGGTPSRPAPGATGRASTVPRAAPSASSGSRGRGWTSPRSSPSRTNSVSRGRSSFPSRTSGFGRSGIGSSGPSFGRGGFSRPAGGGARSVPTARGR